MAGFGATLCQYVFNLAKVYNLPHLKTSTEITLDARLSLK